MGINPRLFDFRSIAFPRIYDIETNSWEMSQNLQYDGTMTQIENLLKRAEHLADARGQSISTISRKLFNDGKAIGRLKAGGQCTLKTLERAEERLAALLAATEPVPKNPPKKTNAKGNNTMDVSALDLSLIHI